MTKKKKKSKKKVKKSKKKVKKSKKKVKKSKKSVTTVASKTGKKEALKKIKAGNLSLQDADKKLKADKEVVLAAIKQDGPALEHADKKLKADKEVVLAAVKQYGSALEHADSSLKKDKEVVLEAIKNDGSILFSYADDSLKKDKKIVLEAIKKKHSVLQYANESLQKEIDPSFAFSESSMTGSEFNYDEFYINEKDINSAQKIKDFFSDDRDGSEHIGYIKGLECDPHDNSKGGLLLGTISEKDKNKLGSLDVSIDDQDVDFSNIKITGNIGGGKAEKGQIYLTYYYYMTDAGVELKTYKKNKKFCLSVESFGNLAIASTNEETQEFEYALQSTGSGTEGNWQIVFDDGKIIECNNDRNELIESISKYLISKKVFNK